MRRLLDFLRKLNNPLINHDGFTLIEAIVTIAIVGIVVTPIAMVFHGSLVNSLESRKQMKANQIGQQYVELLETMEYEELKRLVDDYAGVVDSTTISTGGFDLPVPMDGYDIVIDLHYGSTRSDGLTTDPEYNTAFDNLNFVLSPTILDAPLPSYNMLLHMDSATDSGIDFFRSTDPFDDGSGTPAGEFTAAAANRDIEIVYAYTSADKINTEVSVTQNSVTKSYSYVTGTENNQFIIYCDDDISNSGLIDTFIEVKSFVEESVTFYVYETVNDKIKPQVSIGLGEVNVIRGLSVVDTTSNTHRLYEIEVMVALEGESEPLIHVVTTRLAK